MSLNLPGALGHQYKAHSNTCGVNAAPCVLSMTDRGPQAARNANDGTGKPAGQASGVENMC